MTQINSPLIGVCQWAVLCLFLCCVCSDDGVAATEPDHRASLDWDAADKIYRLKWPALSGRTYFMQYTPDLIEDWIWIPAVVSGDGATKTWAFDVAGEKGFWRLVSSDIPTDDPSGDDFDGDGVSNLAELLQGTHPLENFDNDHDGFPDDWEAGAGLNPSDATDGADADSDGDGLTNAEERLAGTLMQNPDSDGDGVEDGRDGWANNSALSPARLPGTSYAALALDQLGLPYIAPADLYEALYTADMNDQGLIRMKDANGSFIFVPGTGQVFRFPAGHTFGSYARISNAGTLVSTFGSNGTGVWHYNGTWTPAVPHVGPLGPGEPHHYLLPYGAACTNALGSLVAEITGQSVQDPPPYNNPTYAEKWGYMGHGFWSEDVTHPPGAAHHYHHRFYYDFGTNQFNQITTGGTWLSPRYLNDQNLATGGVRQVVGGTRSSAEQFSDGTTGPFMVQTLGPGLTEAGGAPQILPGGVDAWVDVSSQDSAYLVGGREIGYTGYYEPLLWQKQDGAWQMINLAETVPDMNFVWDVNSRAQFIGSIQRGEEYREVLVENGAVVNLDEKLASSGWKDVFPQYITESGVILAAATKTQDQTLHGVMLVPMGIAVDANRDGEIQMGSSVDKTTQNKPYRFWVNDDNDSGDEDHPGSSIQDYANFEIEGKRDLEDFARLHLNIGGFYEAIASGQIKIGLKWKNVTGDPSIRVYRAVESDGKDNYLRDDNVAGQQVTGVYKACITDIHNRQKVAASGFIFPTSFWSGLSAENTKKNLLFEVSGEGGGQLVLTIHKSDGTEIGEGAGVWLDLKNIRDMYERAHASIDTTIPSPVNAEFGCALDKELPADSSEDKNLILYVHGMNTDDPDYYQQSETLFKRLWWRGFKGRFASFRWPSPMFGFVPDDYNTGEFRAWKSGGPLKDYINYLKASPRFSGYTTNVAVHSMGNIVMGEAIRQGVSVDNYALMQAATSAKCYDGNNANLDFAPIMENEPLFPTPDEDDIGGYKNTFNQAVRRVNFYNEFDWALSTGPLDMWEGNQKTYKPDNLSLRGGGKYRFTTGDGKCWADTLFLGTIPISYREVTDDCEKKAFVGKSRSRAVGASGATRAPYAMVGGSITTNVNLRDAAFGFTAEKQFGQTREEHSGQFTKLLCNAIPFYDALMQIAFNIQPNP